MTTTITNQTPQTSERKEAEPGAVVVRRRHRNSLRRTAVALVAALLATVGVAATSADTASAAQSASPDTHAPFREDSNCNYHTNLPNGSEGFYTQFWTYDSSRGGWSAEGWRYTSVSAGDWVHNGRAWQRSNGRFTPPPSSNTVYIYAYTWTPTQGYVGHKLDRCYNGRTYLGW